MNTRNIIVIMLLSFISSLTSYSQTLNPSDSVTILSDTTAIDSLQNKTADTINLKTPNNQKSNQIDAEINYTAKDSIVFLRNGVGFLHGASDITYKNINLKADFVRLNMDSSLIFARGTTDSVGKKIGEPVFSEGDKSYSSRELAYNLQTKKGFIKHAVTQEGEAYIISEKTKKTADDEYCMAGGKYTTCSNHDHPDFYLSISKGKVKPGEYIVAGPAHLVVQDVPLPLAIPFGFFPFTKDYSSGILMPSYADELNRGFGLTNGGYYFAISDYMDLELRGDVYTKGTWALRGSSTYLKRYKFRGNFGVEYRDDVTGEEDMPDYNSAKSFKISWTHNQDTKANPNFTFSSSVNFSTSGFNRSNINYYSRPELNSENTKQSNINFTKRFPELSSLSISGGVSVTQRTSDSTISMSLPSLNISYSRFYPLKRKEAIGKERWYEKISMSYAGALSNSITTKENLLLSSSLQRDWRNGMKHTVPVSATFNLFNYLNITPTFNYTERWYSSSIDRNWDVAKQKVVTDTVYGFNRVYDFNMGISTSTKLYGYYIPIRAIFGDKVDRIRHVMTPTLGFSYKPDFGEDKWGYYDTYTKSLQSKTDPTVYTNSDVTYSRYEGSLYGTPGAGKSGNINFSLGNNVEMKLRNDNDTTGENPFKKISLIDNLSVGGSYNMAADSMNWSVFSANLRLKLTKSYSLTLSTSFDPYMYGLNTYGNPARINKLRWENGQFPRFMGTSTSYSYTLSNETFRKLFKGGSESGNKTGADETSPETDTQQPENTGGFNDTESAKPETTKDGYEKVSIPWSISINYSVQYRNINEFDKSKMEYLMDFTHNLSMSGNVSLTSNWKISASSTYDFKYKQFTYTNINVNRNLHCWSMSASIVPFGMYKSYSFHIGVNASMLADMKYDKQSEYGRNNITWY